MIHFISKRLKHSLVLLFLASVVCFTLVVSAPGNVAVLIAELRGAVAVPGYVAQVAEEIGLNKPLLMRYVDWLGDAVTGDFGISYRTGQAVSADLPQRMMVTGTLIAGSALIATLLSLLLGFLGAFWPYKLPDRVSRGLALIGASTPTFFVGALMIYGFSVTFQLFPSFGFNGPISWVLPWLTVAVLPAAVLSRVVRVGLEEAMTSPYVLTAKSKGLGRTAILFREALPNITPVFINALGTQVGLMTATGIIVEPLFAWQGVGDYFLAGVRFRDFMVVQACLLIFLTFFIVVNLVVDLAVLMTDPRIRRQWS
ncbi:ABC transporter permease [Aminobacter carboxidus]|uniref:ABC transporter permease n=1 Tax=Aminobacter carboxidus TaxID=376165 RepID=A0A8E1WEA3_9HYPH|nr:MULTISPECIES: ABC transporter permease [Aminobacter carboxidus group]MBB6466349.1 peptide/nickel transport system permease protein [Aminobacter lissarensis]MBE1203439.1 ABC transporter permease [Aminobacter carboxidus]